LRQALAKNFSLPEEMVVISNGADNLILMIASAFVDEGDEVVMADPTFSIYTNVTQIMGGRPIKVKLKDYTHDLDSMLRKINGKTKLVFICNPNNPTGTTISQEALNHFLSKLPNRVIVVLDEAYGDFAEDPFYPNGLDYLRERDK
jgi:histidinol-phosphate aminotransferase